MQTARISTKGQITLPKKIRDLLGVKPGQSVAFIAHRGQIEVVAVNDDLMSLAGALRVKRPEDQKVVREKVRSERAKYVAHKGKSR